MRLWRYIPVLLLLFAAPVGARAQVEIVHPSYLSFEDGKGSSAEHYKTGSRSLKWSWCGRRQSLSLKVDVGYLPGNPNPEETSVSSFVFWVYSPKPLEGSLRFEFLKGGKVCCAFPYKLGFTGWRGAWVAFDRDMEAVCRHYSEMGVKGFKIDFMDRDDQIMVSFHERAARMCAKYHLLADFHGTYKPTGLSRTWPNVINYEGVNGLEQCKWSDFKKLDQVTYDVTMPFIRMAAGPVDYTQGAMKNANRDNFRGVYREPMSQGTRCHQLAEYVIFESPLTMLCDSPANYRQEPECTDFIARIPTVWDETRAVDGDISHYIVMARRKAGTWYVGALSDWDGKRMEVDLGFIPEGKYMMEIFRDGANASRHGTDYKREVLPLPDSRKITIRMASGGGWAAIIYPKQ